MAEEVPDTISLAADDNRRASSDVLDDANLQVFDQHIRLAAQAAQSFNSLITVILFS